MVMSKVQKTMLKRAEVEERLSVSKSFIDAGLRAGTFPRPMKIGPRCHRWPVKAIEKLEAEGMDGAEAD